MPPAQAARGNAMSLLADYNLPFAISFGIMVLLALLQLTGLGDFDTGADLDLDTDLDPTSATLGGAITTLLGLGRVPLLVWLITFLLVFTVIGMSVQGFAQSLTGAPLFSWLAALIAGGASVPLTALLARPLGAIMPRDETSAVGLGSLVGRRAVITTGHAAADHPARASVKDRHGHTHHVMVEPHEAGSRMEEGDELLLVRREGQVFYGVALSERKLSPTA